MREPCAHPVGSRPGVVRRSGGGAGRTGDPSAVLLVRVWREEGTGSFRARLVVEAPVGDPPAEPRTVAVASSPGEVLIALRHWLDAFLHDTRWWRDGGR
ncbi:hypothetical protein [Modestobacter versicolor]|uniref:hypothetical protein n=1 Tax=Modestobacter versicolor TaxID=429133 RepID=UPI0034DE150F